MSEEKETQNTEEPQESQQQKELNPKEAHQKFLDEQPWPPKLQVGEHIVELDELDVSWTLCTVLKMRWLDVQKVTEVAERKFLYNKAMMVAESLGKEQEEIDAKKAEVEGALRRKLESLEKEPLAESIANMQL